MIGIPIRDNTVIGLSYPLKSEPGKAGREDPMKDVVLLRNGHEPKRFTPEP
jgi:hypothetical protein